jgi:CubicO group peptidase (beta-lactamase class C family)
VKRAPAWSASRSLKPPSTRSPKRCRSGLSGYENATNEKGERLIWLDSAVVARLRSLRGPGESYSDVILRLAGGAL